MSKLILQMLHMYLFPRIELTEHIKQQITTHEMKLYMCDMKLYVIAISCTPLKHRR